MSELTAQFSLTDHCCRHCLGRILVRNRIFMCSVCEVQAADQVSAICGCGMRSATNRELPRDLRQAYRCGINPNRSVVSPARIVVLYGDAPVQPLGAT